jgi:geranylgeranyl diphosphate synthase type I
MGAILGGADEDSIKNISSYSIPIGIAFQIQDDILGIFGSEKKIGKSVGADIREGKQTILLAKAREWADKAQREIIKKCIGNNDLTKDDISEFQGVIKDTGALEYARKKADELITIGKDEIRKARLDDGSKEFLLGLAQYMMEREV